MSYTAEAYEDEPLVTGDLALGGVARGTRDFFADDAFFLFTMFFAPHQHSG